MMYGHPSSFNPLQIPMQLEQLTLALSDFH